MHKYQVQIKYLAAALLGLSLWIPALAQQQPHGHSALFDIQQAYVRGEIDVETAALKQFQVLYEPGTDLPQIHKCATPAFMFLENHRDELSPQARQKINSYLAVGASRKNKAAQQSHISPSGHFEIFYTTSGRDSVSVTDENGNGIPDYIDKVAASADSTYRHEIETLGFTDPINEGGQYQIYVEHITFGAYGYTEPIANPGANTIFYLENDFLGFPENSHPEGDQTGAIYATIAHEFKHAIQFAQNLWRSPSGEINWSEMDATLMEEVVYDDVNDYYNYIKTGFNTLFPHQLSVFGNPGKSVPGSYNFVSWMIYYSEALGNEIWGDVWELIEEDNFLGIDEAMAELFVEREIDFDEHFVRNHLWHFASGAKMGEDNYGFGEKEFYPTPSLDYSFNGAPDEPVTVESIDKLAARYFEIIPAENDKGLIEAAVDFDSTQVGIGLLLYMKSGEIQEKIAVGSNKAQVYLPTQTLWDEVDRVGVVVANFDLSANNNNLLLSVGSNKQAVKIRDPDYVNLPDEFRVYQNYPNPFNPTTNIDFELSRSAFVELEVFDITGRKIKTLLSRYLRVGSYTEPFDGTGLSSGIYLYRLRIDDAVFVKKMTLIK